MPQKYLIIQYVTEQRLLASITWIPPPTLQRAVEEAEQIVRPDDDNYFDFLATRYNYLRQFTPAFLQAFSFQSNVSEDLLLKAIAVLRHLNATQRRALPADAPLDFVTPKWQPYVLTPEGQLNRHYYELCVLWELRNALRAGNVWLSSSRRYAESRDLPDSQDAMASLAAGSVSTDQTPRAHIGFQMKATQRSIVSR